MYWLKVCCWVSGCTVACTVACTAACTVACTRWCIGLTLCSPNTGNHISELRAIFQQYKSTRNDDLVGVAASKALEMSSHTASSLTSSTSSTSSAASTSSSPVIRLSGDPDADALLRAQHRYKTAPDVTLCCNVLNLISDHDPCRAGEEGKCTPDRMTGHGLLISLLSPSLLLSFSPSLPLSPR